MVKKKLDFFLFTLPLYPFPPWCRLDTFVWAENDPVVPLLQFYLAIEREMWEER